MDTNAPEPQDDDEATTDSNPGDDGAVLEIADGEEPTEDDDADD